jgi:hypothetical protein
LHIRDLRQNLAERWGQVRFVMNDQRILTNQTRMLGAPVRSVSVSAEQKFAADHVDGADYDCRTGWVGFPFLIVGEFAPQSTDS